MDFRCQGLSDICVSNSDESISGNPARHFFVDRFLKGYNRKYSIENNGESEVRAEPILYEDWIKMRNVLYKSLYPEFIKIMVEFFCSLSFQCFLRVDK